MNAKELLIKAADLIETKGWIQGSSGSLERGFCILGAMDQVCAYETHFASAYKAAQMKLRQEADTNQIAVWNDEVGQTKENVLATMRKAAEQL